MTIDFSEMKPSREPLPPRIVLFGTPKIGKSTFAANIPNAIFLDVEGGTGHLNVTRVKRDMLSTWTDVCAVLDGLLVQEHQFGAVVLDTADFLEKVLQTQAAAEHDAKTFAKIGYGKGDVSVANMWREVTQKLDALRERRGMAIILIAHETVKKVTEPEADSSYDRFTLALAPKSTELIEAWADVILFAKVEVYTSKKKEGLKEKVTAVEGDRVLMTRDTPHHLAGNRYNLPEVIPFTWEAFSEAFVNATK
jgi:hypothetical protein